MIRLLISSAGRRVELINCFRHAAAQLKLKAEILAIDMEPLWSPACQIADYSYKVPACTSPDFFPRVMEICQHQRVDLIVPTIDTELIGYARHREQFSKIGTDIHLSSEAFVKVARDKLATAQVLQKHGVPTPSTWTFEEVSANPIDSAFPLMMKPVDGSCSKGIRVVHSRAELLEGDFSANRYIVQAICQGQEFTVNCFYDRSGKCAACVPHFRKMVRAGEVCFAETKRIPAFRKIADQLADIFPGIRGCICFQGYRDDEGHVNLFEINARFGGGYPICDKAGGSFARWILQEVSGAQPDYHDNWKSGVRMLRYDAAVFVES